VKAKGISNRARAQRRTMLTRERPLRRCRECLLVATEVPDGFECRVAICPRNFQRIAIRNGVIIE